METTAAATSAAKVSPTARTTLLILSCILYIIGACGGPLITRLYFIHGGNRVWLSAFLQTAGFPLVGIVLVILYFRRRAARNNDNEKTICVYIRARLFSGMAFVGVIFGGLNTYLYSYGVARLPVSTASLIMAAQLGFMALSALLLVKQKFTAYSVNAVVLLTIGAAMLALHTRGDRPAEESKKEYLIGFVVMVAASLLIGVGLPVIELMYNKAKQTMTFTLVLESQMVLCVFATTISTFGMIISNDFKLIPKEATNFELGKTAYYAILCGTALIWQCNFIGSMGVIFCASSLLSGIIGAALLPVTEILSVVFYKEKFQIEKGVSMVLSLWGFVSYFYGEFKLRKQSKSRTQISSTQINGSSV